MIIIKTVADNEEALRPIYRVICLFSMLVERTLISITKFIYTWSNYKSRERQYPSIANRISLSMIPIKAAMRLEDVSLKCKPIAYIPTY